MSPPRIEAHSVRRLVGSTLHNPSHTRGGARLFNQLLGALILANVVAVVIDTLPQLPLGLRTFLEAFEAISFAIFAIEYGARLWSCVEVVRFSDPVKGRLRYAVRLLPLVDLAVLLSYFAPFDLRFLRLIRIVRLLRVLHLQHYEQPLKAIGGALSARKPMLVVALVAMFMLMFFSAAGMYYIEHDTQPAVFSSIPAAMWWAVMTLTTVGYGDVIPLTPLGKVFAAIIATCGIAVFAMPMAIVTAAILDVRSGEAVDATAARPREDARSAPSSTAKDT